MRPTYERKSDLINEQRVIKELIPEGWTAEKLKYAYEMDFAVYNEANELECFWEVKCYKKPHNSFPTQMLSLTKLMKAKQLAEVTGKPVNAALNYNDGVTLYVCLSDICHPTIKHMGRKDRGDWQDMEPCIIMDKATMRRVIR